MWKYFGVLANAAAVLLGGGLGLLLRRMTGGAAPRTDGKYPPRERLPEAMMVCLGFCTVFPAASGVVGVAGGVQALVCVFSMAAGLLVGWCLRLDDAVLAKMGGAAGAANPAEGFVTACLLFCVGSMTVLGSFESAANPAGRLALECHTTLLIKSLLDFVSSACLTVACGASVLVSAAFVLAFQGTLVALAASIRPFLERVGALGPMNCVGSLILLVIAVNLIGLKKVKTADYLPALFLPILVCWALSALGVAV